MSFSISLNSVLDLFFYFIQVPWVFTKILPRFTYLFRTYIYLLRTYILIIVLDLGLRSEQKPNSWCVQPTFQKVQKDNAKQVNILVLCQDVPRETKASKEAGETGGEQSYGLLCSQWKPLQWWWFGQMLKESEWVRQIVKEPFWQGKKDGNTKASWLQCASQARGTDSKAASASVGRCKGLGTVTVRGKRANLRKPCRQWRWTPDSTLRNCWWVLGLGTTWTGLYLGRLLWLLHGEELRQGTQG